MSRTLHGPALLVALAIVAALAGCVGEEATSGDPAERAPGTGARVLGFPTVANVSTEQAGAEPVVDVGPEGRIYLEAIGSGQDSENRNRVWRSTDDGRTWTELELPEELTQYSGDGYVEVSPEGTVYIANAYGPDAPPGQPVVFGPNRLQIARSTDAGETWTVLELPPLPDSIHRMWLEATQDDTVHIAVAGQSSPASTLVVSPPGPRPLYYLRSEDDGESWSEPVPVHRSRSLGSDLVVDTGDGSLHVAILLRDPSRWSLFSSTDAGQTWTNRTITELGGSYDGVWAGLSQDTDGTLYLTWVERRDERPITLYTYSTDGASWAQPRPLKATNGSQMLAWSEAAGPGVLDAAWYATDQRSNPGSFDAPWHVEAVRVSRADTSAPNVSRIHRTPWPVHEGDVCIGLSCFQEDAERDLLDFLWLTHGPEGRIHVGGATTQGWDGTHGRPLYAGVDVSR